MNTTKEILQRAILHYTKRLRDLVEDDEEEIKTDIIKADLLADAREAEQLLYIQGNLTDQERPVVCAILECYLQDLKQSKLSTLKNLGNITPTFKAVDQEIILVSDLKDKLCAV